MVEPNIFNYVIKKYSLTALAFSGGFVEKNSGLTFWLLRLEVTSGVIQNVKWERWRHLWRKCLPPISFAWGDSSTKRKRLSSTNKRLWMVFHTFIRSFSRLIWDKDFALNATSVSTALGDQIYYYKLSDLSNSAG